MIYNAYQDTPIGICGVSVVSCGHIFAQKGRKIVRPTGRSDFLLFYVVKGSEHFFLDCERVADAGSFIFFRPFERQEHIYKESKTGEFYYIHFNAPSDFDLFGFDSSVIYKSKPNTTVCDIFEEIISELQKKQPAYEKLCVSKLFTLFSLFERKTKKESTPQGKYFDYVSFVIQKMSTEYHVDHTLSDYARMCNMSKFHFSRVFKDITGFSPLEYRNEIRLNHVKEQIKDSDTTIEEISRNAGFTSLSYFCTVFKKKTGMTPSQYRRYKLE